MAAARKKKEKPSCLVVDDQEDSLESLADVVREGVDGSEVEALGDPQKALDRLAEKKFHVVIADLRMPGVDGMRLLEKTRELQPDAFRVLVTGTIYFARNDPTLIDLLIPKPLNAENLVRRVQRFLKEGRRAPGPA